MRVKICGLQTITHALAAATAGADLLGLNFFPGSRRFVDSATAQEMVAAVHAHPGPRPLIVGLFVNAPAATINRTSAEVGLDLVQLSGDEEPEPEPAIDRPLLKSIRLDGSAAEAAWIALAQAGRPTTGDRRPTTGAPIPSPLLLIDAAVPGAYGGTGARADWGRAATLAAQIPLLLAGGLHPGNVAEAIAQVRPWGVDVSSGVETAGVKDAAKIAAFVAAAKAAP